MLIRVVLFEAGVLMSTAVLVLVVFDLDLAILSFEIKMESFSLQVLYTS